MLFLLLSCAPQPADSDSSACCSAPADLSDIGYTIDAPDKPAAIVEWTEDSLILDVTGPDSAYWFGISEEEGDNLDLVTWTGEDCYLGWDNEYTGKNILYCHLVQRGVNIFATDAYTQGLDPATETWFGIDDYHNPNMRLSYSLWSISHGQCWSWGADYYIDICEELPTP